MTAQPGLVGRLVSVKVQRGDKAEHEVCEVVACEVVACEYGPGYGWKILVATNDGALLSFEPPAVRLVATPDGGGPYR